MDRRGVGLSTNDGDDTEDPRPLPPGSWWLSTTGRVGAPDSVRRHTVGDEHYCVHHSLASGLFRTSSAVRIGGSPSSCLSTSQ